MRAKDKSRQTRKRETQRLSKTYDQLQAEWSAVLWSHSSGCERCQGDHGCTPYRTLEGRRYRRLSKRFPGREPELRVQYMAESDAIHEELARYESEDPWWDRYDPHPNETKCECGQWVDYADEYCPSCNADMWCVA